MGNLLSDLKGLVEAEKIRIDFRPIRLFDTYTVMILVIFIVISLTGQFVGNPVECTIDTTKLPTGFMDTFCWINPTFVDSSNYTDITDGKLRYITYYEWIVYLLFFQAVMFHFPKALWISWEDGTVRTMTMDLREGLIGESSKSRRIRDLAVYFTCNWKTHGWYARRYFFCRLFCILNLVGQVYLLNVIFYYLFTSYGISVVWYHFHGGDMNPMEKIFPHDTKCIFTMKGEGSQYDKYTSKCVLTLNPVYSKLFLFLWFWYFLLLIMLCSEIFLYIILLSSLPARVRALCFSYGDYVKEHKAFVQNASFGDWLLFFMIGQNLDFIDFRDLMSITAGGMENSKNVGEGKVDAFTQISSQYILQESEGETDLEDQWNADSAQIEEVEETKKSTEKQTSILEMGLKICLNRPKSLFSADKATHKKVDKVKPKSSDEVTQASVEKAEKASQKDATRKKTNKTTQIDKNSVDKATQKSVDKVTQKKFGKAVVEKKVEMASRKDSTLKKADQITQDDKKSVDKATQLNEITKKSNKVSKEVLPQRKIKESNASCWNRIFKSHEAVYPAVETNNEEDDENIDEKVEESPENVEDENVKRPNGKIDDETVEDSKDDKNIWDKIFRSHQTVSPAAESNNEEDDENVEDENVEESHEDVEGENVKEPDDKIDDAILKASRLKETGSKSQDAANVNKDDKKFWDRINKSHQRVCSSEKTDDKK